MNTAELHSVIASHVDQATADHVVATVTTADINFVATMLKVGPEMMNKVVAYLVRVTATRAVPVVAQPAPLRDKKELTEVFRKYRCRDCGYYHEHGVTVTLDGFDAETGEFRNTGWWACDECGNEFWENIRFTKKDLQGAL